MFGRKKVAMMVAEFVGTGILLLSVLSVRSSGIGYSFFVALGAGLAVAALTFIFSEDSGAQFNPALTIGLWAGRKVKTLPAIVYVVLQLLGAWFAFWVFKYFAHTHLPIAPAHYMSRIMVAEAVGTFVFVLGWTAAAAQKFEGLKRAATLGGSFALAILIASLAVSGTGVGFANPALALGSSAWGVWGNASSWATWLNYVVGPVAGAAVAVYLYHYFLMPVMGKSASKTKKK